MARDQGTAAPAADAARLQRGNGWDITALVACALGAVAILSGGMRVVLMVLAPPVALMLGLVAVVMAQRAHDQPRTRVLGWFGLAGGIVTAAALACAVVVYALIWAAGFVFLYASIFASGAGMP
jgi:hypothetical protein